MFVHCSKEIGRVAGGRDDVEAPRRAQQQRESFAQQRVVLGDHNPHGRLTVRVGGPPAELASAKAPSSASIRRRIPPSPEPPDPKLAEHLPLIVLAWTKGRLGYPISERRRELQVVQ
nr:hypothetical protein [Amycolatopsis rubida]